MISWWRSGLRRWLNFAVDGLRLKGFESHLGRVFQTCVYISYHDNVTKMILNQDSKLGWTRIENGYSVRTVDYLAIVDYPVIFIADMTGNILRCGLTSTNSNPFPLTPAYGKTLSSMIYLRLVRLPLTIIRSVFPLCDIDKSSVDLWRHPSC